MSGTNYTTTPNLGLYKPLFNADVGNWGAHWNTNADVLDQAIGAGSVGPWLPLAGGTLSGALNYTATGGTTSRAAQDRAAEVVNVRDFGAVMDGVTDDFTAVTAAISYASTHGAIIYFPPSATPCLISQQLICPTNVVWYAYPGTVTLKPTPGNVSNPMLFGLSNKANVTVYGLTFDGGGQDFATANPVIGLFHQNGLLFDHCTFQNTRGLAINGSGINDFRLRACTFQNIGNHWKTTGLAADRIQALSNTNGDDVTWGFRMSVQDCYFTDIGLDAINLGHIHEIRIVGNTFNLSGLLQHPSTSFGSYSAAAFLLYCQDIVISGNLINNAPGQGIDTPGSKDITITGNAVRGSGGAAIGIFDGTGYSGGTLGSSNITITGNVLENSGQWSATTWIGGISLDAPSTNAVNIRIANNIICDTQGTPTQKYGVFVRSAASTVTGWWLDQSNVMTGNVTAALSPNVPTSLYRSIATVSGSRGGNAALQSLLAGLAAANFITDTTTA